MLKVSYRHVFDGRSFQSQKDKRFVPSTTVVPSQSCFPLLVYQYEGGLLPGIILLIDPIDRRGNHLNPMKLLSSQPLFPPKRSDVAPPSLVG